MSDYSRKLADKHGLTVEQVEAILTLGLRNLCGAVLARQEVSLRGLFTIYVHKKARARELKRCQKNPVTGSK